MHVAILQGQLLTLYSFLDVDGNTFSFPSLSVPSEHLVAINNHIPVMGIIALGFTDSSYTVAFLILSIALPAMDRNRGKHYLYSHFVHYLPHSQEISFDNPQVSLSDFIVVVGILRGHGMYGTILCGQAESPSASAA